MPRLELKARTSLDGSGFQSGLRHMEVSARKTASQISSNIKGAIAGAFGFAAISAATREVINFGSRINDLSNRTGISTDALQEFDYIAQQTGTDLDAFVKVFQKLVVIQAEAKAGSSKHAEQLQKLGVSMTDLRSKSPQEVFFQMIRGMRGASAEGGQFAAFLDVFGQRAGEVFGAAQDDLEALRMEADRFKLPPETIKELDRIGDEFVKMKKEAAPTLATLAEGFGALTKAATGTAKVIGAVFQGFGAMSTKAGWQRPNSGELVSPVQRGIGPRRMAELREEYELLKQKWADEEKAANDAEDARKDEEKSVAERGKSFIRGIPGAAGRFATMVDRGAKAIRAGLKEQKEPTFGTPSVNELQRIGAFAPTQQRDPVLAETTKQTGKLDSIDKKTDRVIEAIKGNGIF